MDVDAVVTDIDGVLVDTSESYHRAIVESVCALHGETIERHDTQAFKNAGGFNNDWVTTDAVALYVLVRQHGYDISIGEFTDIIEAFGGGLEGTRNALADLLTPADREVVLDAWDPAELRRTFQWLYLGPERYREFEDDPLPAHRPDNAGFMDDEPILLDPQMRSFLQEQVTAGVLTGRPEKEAWVALERVGLSPPPELIRTMDDWEGSKPDPDGLVDIAKNSGAQTVVYIGDELDDVRTAVNANAADPDRSYVGVGVLTGGLSGPDGRRALLDVGADEVLESINDLPAILAD